MQKVIESNFTMKKGRDAIHKFLAPRTIFAQSHIANMPSLKGKPRIGVMGAMGTYLYAHFTIGLLARMHTVTHISHKSHMSQTYTHHRQP